MSMNTKTTLLKLIINIILRSVTPMNEHASKQEHPLLSML